MGDQIARPPTPQAMVHRLPEKPHELSSAITGKPEKFVIIVAASTAVAGKLQVAQKISAALACPLFQGDSFHESAAKAPKVGSNAADGFNEGRYQRMWLSKVTRSGLLFPEESRAAGTGFSGFGGSSSTSTSRPGSASSDAFDVPTAAAPSQADAQRKASPALVVLTHPELEKWQKACIRKAVGEYSIGVIFVPLDADNEDDNLPVLRPLDPRTFTSFGSLASLGAQEQARD